MKGSSRFRPSAASVPLLVALGACVEPGHVERQWTALGRPASAEVWATSARAARELADALPEGMDRVEATMSRQRPDSELNRINAEALHGYYRVADHDLFRAVALACDYAKASDGAYDPTLGPLLRLYEGAGSAPPDAARIAQALSLVGWEGVAIERGLFSLRFRRPGIELDLAGLIEGYALDVTARKFVRAGSLAGLLRLGHQAYAWGRPPHTPEWWVDLLDPRSADARRFARLRIDVSRGIGASGGGGPGAPVLDPRSGGPAASDVVAAIAIADSAADAIAVSRALLVSGSIRAGALLGERTHRVEAILLVDGAGEPQVIASASLRQRLELAEALAREAGGRLSFLLPPQRLVGRLD